MGSILDLDQTNLMSLSREFVTLGVLIFRILIWSIGYVNIYVLKLTLKSKAGEPGSKTGETWLLDPGEPAGSDRGHPPGRET